MRGAIVTNASQVNSNFMLPACAGVILHVARRCLKRFYAPRMREVIPGGYRDPLAH